MKKLLTLAAMLATASLSFGQGYVTDTTTTSFIKTNNAGTLSGNAAAYNGGYNSTTPGPGASWYYELLVAPTSQTTIDATLSGWTAVLTGTNQSTAGREQATTATDNAGTVGLVQIPGFAGGTTANFAVVGWSANLGTDWNAVFAGRPAAIVNGAGNGTTPVTGTATWANTTAAASAGWTQANLSSQMGDHAGLPGAFYGISSIGLNIALVAQNSSYNDVMGGSGITALNMNYYVIPEPATFALAGMGAAALLIFRRRK